VIKKSSPDLEANQKELIELRNSDRKILANLEARVSTKSNVRKILSNYLPVMSM